MAPLAIPITVAQAKELTGRIKRSAEDLWRLLGEAHERKAWQPLGYKSFKAYAQAEFGMSESAAHRSLLQYKVVGALNAATGDKRTPARGSVSARQAARIEPHLPEAKAEVKERVEAGEAPERVVPEVIKTYGAPPKTEPEGSPDVEESARKPMSGGGSAGIPADPIAGSSTPSTAGIITGTPGFGGPGEAPEGGPIPSGATDPTNKGQGDEGAEVEGDVGAATARVPDDGSVGHDHGASAPEPSPAVGKGEGETSGPAAVAGSAPSSPPTLDSVRVDGWQTNVAALVRALGTVPDEYAEVADTDDLRVLASWCHRNLAARGFEDPHEVCRAAIADMQRLLDEARGRAA